MNNRLLIVALMFSLSLNALAGEKKEHDEKSNVLSILLSSNEKKTENNEVNNDKQTNKSNKQK